MAKECSWEGMRVLPAEEVSMLLSSKSLAGLFCLYPDGTEGQIDASYKEEDILRFLERGGAIGEELEDAPSTRLVGELCDGTVDELIQMLEKLRGRKVSLMGAAEFYIHIAGDTVILDEQLDI